MSSQTPVRLHVSDGVVLSKNKAHLMREIGNAYDRFVEDGAHGELRVVFGEKGRAKRLCRTVNLVLEDD